MIRVLSILLLVGSPTLAEDGLFVMDRSRKPSGSVEGSELVMRMALEKLDAPEAKRVILFDSQGSHDGRYTIQVDLTRAPEEGWMPVLVLGDDVILEVGVSRSELGSTLSFGADDPERASRLHRRLGEVFGLSSSQVLDRREGGVEPTAAPEPFADALLKSSETMTNRPDREAPAEGVGR